MASARTLVFPSVLYEGQPMVTIEAFAAGLPVLASSLGGNGELVGGLGERWLAAPADRAAWTAALGRLAGDDGVDDAGRHARRLYEQQFTADHSLRVLEGAYRRAVEGANRRAGDRERPR
jgi:glycosyltransferase involved in cell wall biosynthesis